MNSINHKLTTDMSVGLNAEVRFLIKEKEIICLHDLIMVNYAGYLHLYVPLV